MLFWLTTIACIAIMAEAITGCAAPQRPTWRDCGGVSHEVCYLVEDPKGCEYEFYKECINGS